VEDAADSFALLAELVEVGDGHFRFFNVIFDAIFLEEFFGIGMGLENEVHATREDHDFDVVVEDFGDVGGLGAGVVTGSGFVPVPFAGAARPDFAVFEGLGAAVYRDFHPAPGDMSNYNFFGFSHLPPICV